MEPEGSRGRRNALPTPGAIAAGIGLVAVLPLVGCDGDGDGAGRTDRTLPPPGIACTQIACSSEARVRLADLPRRVRGARVCVAGSCGPAQPVRGPVPFATAPVPQRARREGRVVRVTLELTDRQGDTIGSVTRRAAVRRVRPNGPRCPPVCFQLQLRYDGDSGALLPAPPRF